MGMKNIHLFCNKSSLTLVPVHTQYNLLLHASDRAKNHSITA